jgi:hypothetical protein
LRQRRLPVKEFRTKGGSCNRSAAFRSNARP